MHLTLTFANWSDDAGFKVLESSGLLGQYIRCLAQPALPVGPGPATHNVSLLDTLLETSFCKCAYYCSRDCQKSDWKAHKKTCVETSDSRLKEVEASQQLPLTFATRNYYEIMTSLLQVLDEHSLTIITLVLLELDFFGKGSGAARTRITPPALCTPPQFKIVPTERYVTPIPDRAPNWFY